jgi:hypothetical protein
MNGHPEDWYFIIDGLKQFREPKKISDYIVIAARERTVLSQLIREYSEVGYCLYYGPFTHKEDSHLRPELCQAMVKYE